MPLQPIAGFESTDYALRHGRIVWAGAQAASDHPRNALRPWRPEAQNCDAASLRVGAVTCIALLDTLAVKGMLLWLTGKPLPFPLDHAGGRFDALRSALERNQLDEFEAAAHRVLGLGHGLTPSGDDFVGGILFALEHVPRDAWRDAMPGVLARIRAAATTATNPISAALLDDMIDGASFRELHELLAALQGNAGPAIVRAARALLRVGASSGADMLAGVLLALTTTQSCPSATPP